MTPAARNLAASISPIFRDEQKDEVIKGLEDGSLKLDGTDGQNFFKLILKTRRTAFLPIRSTAATRTWRRGK